MMRLLRTGLTIAILMVLAGLAAWLADQPGRVQINWFGYLVETPAPVLALLVILLAVAVFVVAWIIAWAAALPQRRRLKRQAKGYANFAAGMVAVAAGEPDRAMKLAARATQQLDDPALARLLAAHAAQLGGDEDGARKAFTALAADPGTAFLGLRGLLADARQRGDRAAALDLAGRASVLRPASPFAAEAELRLMVEAGNWLAARRRLEVARKKKAVSKDGAQQLGARLDLAEAQAELVQGHLQPARKLAEQAAKQLPEHPVPPLLLARAADTPASRDAAAKALRRAWARQPAEALAEAWLALQQDLPADTLVQRARDFAADQSQATESQLLIAAAALQAHDYAGARSALAAADHAGRWGARLMARLAEEGDGDAAVADTWRAKASYGGDVALWQCGACGIGQADWMPLCPSCGGFDTLDPTALGETAPLAQPPRPLLPAAEIR
ncbi:heme biosynthesis HemY N-terminal domain-containing protein [Ferrovibrio xuzhouensis]|uniref:Heme biosynthesis HemY N-terminal domain-containing protein n=1 Tax=Ferrovibrio xuzhouensis TaxID=1576914 RepID=A0ABV7VDX4_9PROT